MRLALREEMAEAASVHAWDALALHASEPNPFFESWFLLPALEALPRDGEAAVLRFEIGGDLAGVLPLLRTRRYYGRPVPNLQGWLHPNAFLGAPLVARGAEAPFWRALLDWADRNAGTTLFLHLPEMPLEGALHAALQQVLADRGRTAALVTRHERALLQSDLSPEAYFEASMPGKKRKELRRQHVRLAELGAVEIERRDDQIGLTPWIDRFLLLEAGGWKGAAGSAMGQDPRTERLFRDALQGAARRGRLERLALLVDGQPIAMLANFLTAPGSFAFKTAYDEAFSRFSPGVLLQRENLALLARPGIQWCDSCAAADHPMIERIWREKRSIGRYSIPIGGPLRRATARLFTAAELRRSPAGPTP